MAVFGLFVGPALNFIALAPDLGDELCTDTINIRGQVLRASFYDVPQRRCSSEIRRIFFGRAPKALHMRAA
jgi:hypothetical protein